MAIPYSRYVIGRIPWYSVLIVAGILLCYLLGSREEKRIGLPKDTMLDMALVAVPCGIVGARLYYVLMSWEQFAPNPISALYIWEGGIAIYGAVIGGCIGVWVYARRKKISFGAMLDMAAPGLVLAQALGRWGNYFNREAFGPEITDAAWQFFPVGVLIPSGGAEVWHVATFFYESVWDVACFAVLWLIRKRMRRHGDTFLWYMVLYGSGRFLVEQLRQDSLYIGGIRASQYLSLLIVLAAAAVFLVRLAKVARSRAIAAAMLCAVGFARLLLPASTASAVVMLVLYAFAAVLARKAPLWTKLWLGVDAAVYAALALLGQQALWHSPYFVYAGLSLPPYIAASYTPLAAHAHTTQEG